MTPPQPDEIAAYYTDLTGRYITAANPLYPVDRAIAEAATVEEGEGVEVAEMWEVTNEVA